MEKRGGLLAAAAWSFLACAGCDAGGDVSYHAKIPSAHSVVAATEYYESQVKDAQMGIFAGDPAAAARKEMVRQFPPAWNQAIT